MSNIPRNTSSTDPKLLRARVFIGNLATEKVKREDLTEVFERYGEVIGCSLLRGYGFVQFLSEEDARNAVSGENGKTMHGAVMDVRMAVEGKRSAPEKQEEAPPPREKEASSKSRRRSRSPRRSKWDHPAPHPPPPSHPHDYYPPASYPHEKYPPPESYPPPPQPYHESYYDDYHYYEKPAPPPEHHARHYSPPHRPAYPHNEWEHESRPPRPPPASSWEQDDHARQRRRPSPRPQSPPHSQWYRQSPPSHSDWYRPPSPRQQGPPRPESKVDMEIIVINKQQMDYANMVSRRVQDLGLKVATKALAPTASLSELLDNIAKKGLLYAVIITSQHEVHGSLTLTILYGRNPQEHKNMPLEDALGLINRDFSRYCQAVREGHMRQQSKQPELAAAIVGSGGSSSSSDLTIEQISSVIDNLQQKKNELLQKQAGPLGGIGGGSSIQQQQADLQAKILSLLGSNAVVPPSTRPQPASQPMRAHWGRY